MLSKRVSAALGCWMRGGAVFATQPLRPSKAGTISPSANAPHLLEFLCIDNPPSAAIMTKTTCDGKAAHDAGKLARFMPTALAALRYRDFALYVVARFSATLAWQMLSVAVGWQVYRLTHNPLDLGLVGLAQFLPFVLLVLPAGHVADRADRRRVLLSAYAVQRLCVVVLLWFTISASRTVASVFLAMALFGGGRAFSMPTAQALTPNLVPLEFFPSAVALNSILFEVAVIVGPSLGGVLYLFGPVVVYSLVLGLVVVVLTLIAMLG